MSETTRYAKSWLGELPPEHPFTIIRSRLNPGEEVLDVGCGTGEVGAFLAQSGAHIDGIEPNRTRATLAKTRLRILYEGEAGMEIPRRYDTVCFIDVIEHLVSPILALNWAASLLKGGGSILCMIPNGAHMSARLKILRGDWSYQETGLFDRDHVHFYDMHSVGLLARAGGLDEVTRWYSSGVPRWWPLPRQWSVRRWPNLLASSVLIAMHPHNGDLITSEA